MIDWVKIPQSVADLDVSDENLGRWLRLCLWLACVKGSEDGAIPESLGRMCPLSADDIATLEKCGLVVGGVVMHYPSESVSSYKKKQDANRRNGAKGGRKKKPSQKPSSQSAETQSETQRESLGFLEESREDKTRLDKMGVEESDEQPPQPASAAALDDDPYEHQPKADALTGAYDASLSRVDKAFARYKIRRATRARGEDITQEWVELVQGWDAEDWAQFELAVAMGCEDLRGRTLYPSQVARLASECE